MRFIDRLPDCREQIADIRCATLARRVRCAVADRAAKCPILVADDIAQEAFEAALRGARQNGEFSLLNDLPNVAPPFQEMWIEATTGQFVATNLVGSQPLSFPKTVGFMLHSMPTRDMVSFAHATSHQDHIIRCHERYPDAHWIVSVEGFLERERNVSEMMGHWAYAVDPLGRLIGDLVPFIEEHDNDGKRSGMRFFARLPLLAISFCQCRNVMVREIGPDAGEVKRRARSGSRPLLRYHVLELGQFRKTLAAAGAKDSGIVHAMHICRGHFKTYTPDKPLMGRHVGTWWWGETLRGDAAHGVVTKDYRTKHISELTPPPAMQRPSRRHMVQAAALAAADEVRHAMDDAIGGGA